MRSLLFLGCLLLVASQSHAETLGSVQPDPALDGKMITTVEHLGRTHFRINTRTAVYLYDPVAGGFSSMVDKNGNDWIAYRDDPAAEYPAAAATRYRGLPNLVYRGEDDGAGHPGFNKCESKVVGRNQIHTVTRSGEWAWTWTFYPDAARLDLVRVSENRPYWFLYEGPVGGSYLPTSTFWVADTFPPSYRVHDHYAGDVYRAPHQLLYFGTRKSPVAFFMAQLTADGEPDHVSLLGDAEAGAAKSTDGMLVAGFGRAAGARPLLEGKHSFLIGFVRYTPPTVRKSGTRERIVSIIRRRGNLPDFLSPR